jgi:hypothetical protein
MNHIATGTAPSLDGELLPPHGSSSGDEDGGGDGSGVDGEAFRGHFPVRQGAGTETPVPQILASRWRRLWKVSRTVASSVRVFDAGALNRRRGGAGGSKGRPHHRVARAQPWPRHHVIWGPQGPPLAALGCSGCFRAK